MPQIAIDIEAPKEPPPEGRLFWSVKKINYLETYCYVVGCTIVHYYLLVGKYILVGKYRSLSKVSDDSDYGCKNFQR